MFLIDADPESPPVFDHFLRKFEAMHEVSVLLNIRHVLKPTVSKELKHLPLLVQLSQARPCPNKP